MNQDKGGRPSKGAKARNKTLTIAVTQREYDLAHRAAKKANSTVSSWGQKILVDRAEAELGGGSLLHGSPTHSWRVLLLEGERRCEQFLNGEWIYASWGDADPDAIIEFLMGRDLLPKSLPQGIDTVSDKRYT